MSDSPTVTVLKNAVNAIKLYLAALPEPITNVRVDRAKGAKQLAVFYSTLPSVVVALSKRVPRDPRPVNSVRQNKDLMIEVFICGHDPDDSAGKVDVYTLIEHVEKALRNADLFANSQPVLDEDAFYTPLDTGLIWRQVWKQWVQEIP
jgi:hypothetical protein